MPEKVLLATDGSKGAALAARAAGDLAASLCGRHGARAQVLHAYPRLPEEDAPERTLLAVGSRDLGAIGRMRLGSVSTKIVHAARGPVLVYPPLRGER